MKAELSSHMVNPHILILSLAMLFGGLALLLFALRDIIRIWRRKR